MFITLRNRLPWVCLAGVLLPAAPAIADPAPVVIRVPKAGDVAVVGYLTPPAIPDGVTVEVTSAHGLERVVSYAIDGSTGRFEARLSTALAAGATIRACHATATGGRACGEVAVPLPPKPTPPAAPAIRPPRAGMKIVDGFAGPAGAKPARILVRVFRGAGATAVEMDRVHTDAIDGRGGFSVVLSAPLIEGLVVEATACTGDDACTPGAAVPVIDPGDWGRVRAYFAGGVVFSKGRDDFSQQDLSLAFVVDKSWLQAPPYALEHPTSGRASGGALTFRSLNTFFDTRLTALPVLASDEGASSEGGAAQPVDSFISSKKGAAVQAGVYLPFYGRPTTWRHNGSLNALFVAPVARGGIQTLTGGDVTAEGRALGGDDVFNFVSFGIGLGHYKLSETANRAPEVISYLHITMGRFEAFEVAPDPERPDVRERPWRTAVEGRLKIPETPFQIGFDANVGQGKDDVRFSFSTRFDVGELIGRLKGF